MIIALKQKIPENFCALGKLILCPGCKHIKLSWILCSVPFLVSYTGASYFSLKRPRPTYWKQNSKL